MYTIAATTSKIKMWPHTYNKTTQKKQKRFLKIFAFA